MPAKTKKTATKKTRRQTPKPLPKATVIKCEIPISLVRTGILTGLEYAKAILASAIGDLVTTKGHTGTLADVAELAKVSLVLDRKATEIRRA